jgi:hypothetical protein
MTEKKVTKTQIADAAIAYYDALQDWGAAETDIENPDYHEITEGAEARMEAARNRLYELIQDFEYQRMKGRR